MSRRSKRRERFHRPERSHRALSPLTFGKYRDQPLDSVPKDYLRWCLENLQKLPGPVRFDIECVLAGQKSTPQEWAYEGSPGEIESRLQDSDIPY